MQTVQPRILCVDDEPRNLRLLDALLAVRGYEVLTAESGREALALIEREKVDLVLLDVMMPEMTGHEVCRRIKADEKTRDLPVLFVTALSECEDETAGFAAGGSDFITKPIKVPVLLARVEAHLKIREQQHRLQQSITLLQHEAEIMQQKADLGIQAGCLTHDLNNIFTIAASVKETWDYLPPDMDPGNGTVLKEILTAVAESVDLGIEICRGYVDYLHDIGEVGPHPVTALLSPISMYARQYKGRLQQEIAVDLPPLWCKGHLLKRVFVNLFINAVQAQDEVEDKLILIRAAHENGRLIFSITDNGRGIPAEILPRIFEERFTTKASGTGLGLFLTKQIVEDHGGSITASSEENKGTTFVLSFPNMSPSESGGTT